MPKWCMSCNGKVDRIDLEKLQKKPLLKRILVCPACWKERTWDY